MNQLCKVCGESAAGFHFGAFTCEGCKSFFGRTYNNISAIAGCKNNGECVINKKNRTACKACRLRKCLLVGMSKSGSRYGRRSNWFKIHCLLQEQQTQAQQQPNQNHQQSPNSSTTKPSTHIDNLYQFRQIQQRILPVNTNSIASKTTQQASSVRPLERQSHTVASIDEVGCLTVKSVRQSDTPSDSGASSSGYPPPDSYLGKSSERRRFQQQHVTNESQLTDLAGRISQLPKHLQPTEQGHCHIDLANLLDESNTSQLSSSLICTNPIPAHISSLKHNIDQFTTSTHSVTMLVAAAAAALATASNDDSGSGQDEPIDLSLKSNSLDGNCNTIEQSSSLPTSVFSSPSPKPIDFDMNVINKPDPLDLTLVPSQ